MRSTAQAVVLLVTLLVGCTDALGECDIEKAEEVVYGPNGWAATKGQALVHDSCGDGSLCHSAGAEGKERWGAPAHMDFDMVPEPTGWERIMAFRYEAWEMVRSGDVPATSAQEQLSSGGWKFSPGREPHAAALPSIFSYEGKAAFRNWLACGGPVVGQPPVHFAPSTPVPGDADEDAGVSSDAGSSASIDWSDIFTSLIQPRCALSGCHDADTQAGELSFASECDGYAALQDTGPCAMPRIVPGDANSFLMTKLEFDDPGCGVRMPVGMPLSDMVLETLRDWLASGAPAENCP